MTLLPTNSVDLTGVDSPTSARIRKGVDPTGDEQRSPAIRPPDIRSGIQPVQLEAVELLQVVTLAGWLFVLSGGLLGLMLPRIDTTRPGVKFPQVIATPLAVDLMPAEALPDTTAAAAVTGPQFLVAHPPPLRQPLEIPPSPAFAPLVEVVGEAVFPIPTAEPVVSAAGNGEVVRDELQAPGGTAAGGGGKDAAGLPAGLPGPVVERLEHGSGLGRQPMSYPPAAVRLGQEGTVVVRFNVDEGGRVVEAWVVEPSPWPVLNVSAAAQIRNRWRFPPGSVRWYEVTITFQLKKKP